ncbi:hypothetical protein Tco_0268572 [Tanacetum coccineum]
MLRRNTTSLTFKNKKLKLWFRDALNETLKSEVERLKLETGQIQNDDDLLNQQKKLKEVSEHFGMWEWCKRKKESHIKFKFRRRSRNFHRWNWHKQKNTSGANCEFTHRKRNFDIWKWPLRKKEKTSLHAKQVFYWNQEVLADQKMVQNGVKMVEYGLNNWGSGILEGGNVLADQKLFDFVLDPCGQGSL